VIPADLRQVRDHVAREYAGVFDDAMVHSFVEEYLGTELAEEQVERVRAVAPRAVDVLDVGSGYGSFVLAAREAGLAAIGLEPMSFEVNFSRRRLADARPGDDADAVYIHGDGLAVPLADCSFDVVTLWNVAEHVEDVDGLTREIVRLLRPGGVLLLLCPNYASFRREAHYQVPWLPLLPRPLAIRYLRRLGREPGFFAQHIHYRTPWQVRRVLRAAGMEPRPAPLRRLDKLERPEAIERRPTREVVRMVRRLGLVRVVAGLVRLNQRNPLTRTIDLVAVRR
jgi:SAM-dependent methyltransferase